MNKEISELLELSHQYGGDKEFVIGGGGNTSWKDERHLYVKASGMQLGSLTAEGLICIDRARLAGVLGGSLPEDPVVRDRVILEGILDCTVGNTRRLRPSVETPLHNLIGYAFVVHTHSTRLNAMLCSINARSYAARLFGSQALYVEYCDPGYILYRKLEEEISGFRDRNGHDPQIILVQNHGVFISGDSADEVRSIYRDCLGRVDAFNPVVWETEPEEIDRKAAAVLPAIRMMLSSNGIRILRIRNNGLIRHFTSDPDKFSKVSLPFTPDNIVYCKARPLYVDETGTPDEIIGSFKQALAEYRSQWNSDPKIILIRNIGMIAADESVRMADILLDVFQDVMKISAGSEGYGGPAFLPAERIRFIENWESENYRHSMSRGSASGKVLNRIIIVTGAAQGFGSGIAADLYGQGANVVIADLNADKGSALAAELNLRAASNRALFLQTDVSDAESVSALVDNTVLEFGGLDAFISNAGILHAGGLDEMSPKTFELMTRVNYTGYFLCARYASAVMKLQAKHLPGYLTDIIQINSKSGLRGSKKNFTYAGGKFGGIGLTQSFALELIEFGIKVNSICPGNFFDGPLWSDPENGLFVQYLRSGKVPGARDISDVKRFYESQVPAGRGCTVADVMKAVYYVIEQEYETGQAIPVTGGQVMLN